MDSWKNVNNLTIRTISPRTVYFETTTQNTTLASPTNKDDKLRKENKDEKDRYIRSPRKPVIDDVYESTEIDHANESTQDYYNISLDTEEQYYENINAHNQNPHKQPTTENRRVQDSPDEGIYETQLPTPEEIHSASISHAQMNDKDEIYVNHSVVKKFNRHY
ncbi:uncharacterized protein LOC122789276 isoform X2 [Protopterus annectens]|uniref:uncharacterized protein LOC122789276 isoform X2 n=1 Tax=Protopterus annectens TaxID=7888 RepID=UPI001CFB7495|nr:uncharacterized protein LOC122789276 isoform X2 [Protopterus annectens]